MDYYRQFQPYAMSYQKYEVVRVNGKNGAEMFQMAPNSSILLLDESSPIVWLKTTDGAGYPTLTPYSITPYEPAPEVDLHSLNARISKLEEIINGYQSNASNAKSEKQSKSDKTNG